MSDLTTNILESANETIGIGVESVRELDRQNRILSTAQSDLASTRSDIKQAETYMSNIESFWNRVSNWFSPAPMPARPPPPSTPSTILTDPALTQVRVHDSSEPDIDAILEASQKMKIIANEMSDQLDHSDHILNKLGPAVEDTDHRQASMIKRMDKYTK